MSWTTRTGQQVIDGAKRLAGDTNPKNPLVDPSMTLEFYRQALPSLMQKFGYMSGGQDLVGSAEATPAGQTSVDHYGEIGGGGNPYSREILAGAWLYHSELAPGQHMIQMPLDYVEGLINDDVVALGAASQGQPIYFAPKWVTSNTNADHATLAAVRIYPATSKATYFWWSAYTLDFALYDNLAVRLFLNQTATLTLEKQIALNILAACPESKRPISPEGIAMMRAELDMQIEQEANRRAGFLRTDEILLREA